MIITSLNNPHLKQVINLRDKKERDRTGLTRVEGYEEISFALGCGAKPVELFFAPELTRQSDILTKGLAQGAILTEVSADVFYKIAYREGADGWLAIFPIPVKNLEGLVLPEVPLIVVVNAVEKPGNLGAILRTAEAAGVSAVVSADPVTDWGNPNIVRASKGSLFAVPVSSGNSSEVIDFLQKRRIKIVVASPAASKIYTHTDLKGPVAIIVGSEKYGLSNLWLNKNSTEVKIPMLGKIDSLNVATAAALLIYEAARQRNN